MKQEFYLETERNLFGNLLIEQQEINHVYFGKIVTVIGLETLDRVKISVDNFPQCNGRIFKNQFVADKDELEELTEK